jgi:ubiquinone/menaquinone biosynthesis C-methylase UbiE
VNGFSMPDSQPGTGQRHPAEITAPCLVSVEEGYARWAPTYDQGLNPLLAREERYLEPILANLRAERILDLACGTGRWLKKISLHRKHLGVGIDSSAAMLGIAAANADAGNSIARAVCEYLPFPREVFDLAICSFALGHIADLGPMAAELSRVLQPEADAFVSDLHPEAYAHGWRVGFRDDDGAAEIKLYPRSAEEVVERFYWNGLECVSQASLRLEEEEKPIFTRAGKINSFASASCVPAILVWHFRQLSSRKNSRSS